MDIEQRLEVLSLTIYTFIAYWFFFLAIRHRMPFEVSLMVALAPLYLACYHVWDRHREQKKRAKNFLLLPTNILYRPPSLVYP